MPSARPAEATGTRGFTHISTYKWLQTVTKDYKRETGYTEESETVS